jgi:hypothetical protein
MLAHASTQFPYPGSTAMLDGLSFKIQRLNADGTATISRDGQGASFRRDAPLADLVDPVEAEENAALSLAGDREEADTRIALFLATHLRPNNQIGLYDLRRAVAEAAHIGRIPDVRDYAHLSRIMRHMGWTKSGMTGTRARRQPLYVRGEE